MDYYPKHVMLHALEAEDVPAEGSIRVVREWDSEGFDLRRRASTSFPYGIQNRTCFNGGERYARTIAEVRRIIARTP